MVNPRRRLEFGVGLLALLALLLSACGQLAMDDRGPVTRLEWRNVDVGNVGVHGTFDLEGDAADLVVRGSGSDIWTEADSFQFVYLPISGDVEIRARIDSLEPTHDRAKAGVMIRSSLEAGAMHAMAGVTPAGQAQFIYRLAEDGPSDFDAVTRGDYPAWVRLARQGDTFTAWYSADGDAWQQIGSMTVPMGQDAYVGIAVTSRDQTRLGAAEVRGVRVTGGDGQVVGPTPPGATPPPDTVVPSQWVCGDEPLSPRFSPTFFVAANGNDANDGRSVDRPFRTLQRAANAVRAGDVVWVRGGVYSNDVSFQQSGTVDRPIVFESYPGECAILDGTGRSTSSRVRFEGARFNVFRNFEVRNSPAQGIYLNSAHDNLITNVHTHDNALSGIQNVAGDRNRFAFFITHDNFDPPYGGNADGIGISSGNYNRIDHCVSFRNSDDGVDTWKSTNSVVDRCISFENGFQGGDGNGFKAGGASLTVNTVVRNSIAFGNKMQGFNYNSGRNVTFENNTSFDNGYYGYIAAYASLRNNLAYADARRAWQDDGSNSQAGNSWNLNVGNPYFVSTDPRSPEFLTLSTGSAAVGAGVAGTTSRDLGAIPLGETIESMIGISLASLID